MKLNFINVIIHGMKKKDSNHYSTFIGSWHCIIVISLFYLVILLAKIWGNNFKMKLGRLFVNRGKASI
jgi:hypothetical protein